MSGGVAKEWLQKGYRACAGTIILNKKKEILICRRNTKQFVSWQFVQGGVDGEESFLEGATREMAEEIGLTVEQAKHIPRESEVICYNTPPHSWICKQGMKGQAIQFFLFYWEEGDLSKLKIDVGEGGHPPEFSEVAWMPFDQWEVQLTPYVAPFKKDLYVYLKKLVDGYFSNL